MFDALLSEIKKLEEIKESLKKQQEIVDQQLKTFPENTFFQDEETKIVYKIQRPKIRIQVIPELEFIRTKKPEEKTAQLSKKEAEEAGFKLGA